MGHVVLLGDSIFDNAAYVAGGPDVRAQVQACLPPGWRTTLLAVGGSRTPDVRVQLRQLPPDASHLVVSVGGNDALDHLDFLTAPAQSVAEALDGLAALAEAFAPAYHHMVQAALQHALPTTLCTIYYPRFPAPAVQRRAVTALAVFNDAIIREAFTAGVPLLDLRLICTAAADYANPIEPSVVGGAKIAAAIARAVREPTFTRGRTHVFI
jgi:lysophospholipase L1-like esterase